MGFQQRITGASRPARVDADRTETDGAFGGDDSGSRYKRNVRSSITRAWLQVRAASCENANGKIGNRQPTRKMASQRPPAFEGAGRRQPPLRCGQSLYGATNSHRAVHICDPDGRSAQITNGRIHFDRTRRREIETVLFP